MVEFLVARILLLACLALQSVRFFVCGGLMGGQLSLVEILKSYSTWVYCLFVSLKSPWLFENYKLMAFWLNTEGFSDLHHFYERYKLSRTKVLEVGKVGFGGGKVLGCYWGLASLEVKGRWCGDSQAVM